MHGGCLRRRPPHVDGLPGPGVPAARVMADPQAADRALRRPPCDGLGRPAAHPDLPLPPGPPLLRLGWLVSSRQNDKARVRPAGRRFKSRQTGSSAVSARGCPCGGAPAVLALRAGPVPLSLCGRAVRRRPGRTPSCGPPTRRAVGVWRKPPGAPHSHPRLPGPASRPHPRGRLGAWRARPAIARTARHTPSHQPREKAHPWRAGTVITGMARHTSRRPAIPGEDSPGVARQGAYNRPGAPRLGVFPRPEGGSRAESTDGCVRHGPLITPGGIGLPGSSQRA